MIEEQPGPVEIELDSGGYVRVEAVAPMIFRVRATATCFTEPGLIRYGIVRSQWPPIDCETDRQSGQTTVRTTAAAVSVDHQDGRICLHRASQQLLQQVEPPVFGADPGFRAEFALADGVRLYGLGDHTRDRIQKRGEMAQMWVRNVASYVPIPVVLSDAGWGLFVNTSWRHYVDLGHTRSDRLAFGGRRGELDYFVFAGDDLPALLDHYTEITGKPQLLPLWGYGLTFVCNQQANAREMLDDCLSFRREEIPCDLVGLEPGWMSQNYDFSVDKAWHPDRFYVPHWGPKGPHTFLAAAERLGFKMSLWLCCDYDLSYEEDRRAGVATASSQPASSEPVPSVHPDDFEQDERFGHAAVPMDKLTRPQEPWFEHLSKFVDQGVSAFKMDGANQVNEHPDRRWGNGMDDEEMHNLYPALLNKQMSLGFREQTGRRAMVYSSGGYAGIQRYGATWAGDTGGGPQPLVSILNHGLSGHVNASCDMDVFTPAGIHFGFLQPWSQVCSWAYWRHPWLLGDQLAPVFKRYARLRYRLLPYIYSTAHQAARTGLPIMRAMPLAFPDDPRCDELVHQYMFGDAFLTGAFADELYLPAGRWIDYWSGTVHDGPVTVACTFPGTCGGGLYVRAGATIPEWPLMQYVGQKPVDELGLDVYPHGESTFMLCEDDGISHAYQDGSVATTAISCKATDGCVELEIGARQGLYDGMPSARSFGLRIHLPSAPLRVTAGGEAVESIDYRDGVVHLRVEEDAERSRPAMVRVDRAVDQLL
jgi:alpha-glucosidase